jgi:hypothetical protein
MVFINVLYLPVVSLLSSKPTISHRQHSGLTGTRKSGNFGHGFILAYFGP